MLQYALNSSILSIKCDQNEEEFSFKIAQPRNWKKVHICSVSYINYWVHRHFRSERGVFSTLSLPRVHDAYKGGIQYPVITQCTWCLQGGYSVPGHYPEYMMLTQIETLFFKIVENINLKLEPRLNSYNDDI